MNLYSVLSIGYDLLDKMWFADSGANPRDEIEKLIPNRECAVLDMCCGTFSNGLPIARKNPKNKVIGIDRSEAMLRGARKKVEREMLFNVDLLCKDATATGLQAESFDYIIIGLVLHECTPEFWKSLLTEAHRLLKSDGKLIVLEWDKQERMSRKIKYAPLYAAEVMVNPDHFKKFYDADKTEFFKQYDFAVDKYIRCNYSAVISMNKK